MSIKPSVSKGPSVPDIIIPQSTKIVPHSNSNISSTPKLEEFNIALYANSTVKTDIKKESKKKTLSELLSMDTGPAINLNSCNLKKDFTSNHVIENIECPATKKRKTIKVQSLECNPNVSTTLPSSSKSFLKTNVLNEEDPSSKRERAVAYLKEVSINSTEYLSISHKIMLFRSNNLY